MLLKRRTFNRQVIGAFASVPLFCGNSVYPESSPQVRRNSITDVDGVQVGHFTYKERPTGCTVITAEIGFVAGADVRGGAPGTRESDLLRPENSVDRIDAILLAGGSAFGLAAADGVSKYCEEQGRGFPTASGRVPIVVGAILYDLGVGDSRIRPDATAGYAAAKAASTDPVPEGNVGAGAGATVGKMFGMERAMKAGIGSSSIVRPDRLKVGALVALNCVGDVRDPKDGRIIAGARNKDGGEFVDSMKQLREGHDPGTTLQQNTVIAVVATNAALTKAECTKVAQMAQDALGRCIYPSHTPWDGDTVYAVATAKWTGAVSQRGTSALIVGALAADTLVTAIIRAVMEAESWGPYPSARAYPPKAR